MKEHKLFSKGSYTESYLSVYLWKNGEASIKSMECPSGNHIVVNRYELAKLLKPNKPDYEKAYHMVMEYWDSISDEEKPELDKRLKKLGL